MEKQSKLHYVWNEFYDSHFQDEWVTNYGCKMFMRVIIVVLDEITLHTLKQHSVFSRFHSDSESNYERLRCWRMYAAWISFFCLYLFSESYSQTTISLDSPYYIFVFAGRARNKYTWILHATHITPWITQELKKQKQRFPFLFIVIMKLCAKLSWTEQCERMQEQGK